jgi:hypothetical protein
MSLEHLRVLQKSLHIQYTLITGYRLVHTYKWTRCVSFESEHLKYLALCLIKRLQEKIFL